MKEKFYFDLFSLYKCNGYSHSSAIVIFMLMFGNGYFKTGRMLLGLEYRKNIDVTLSILFINITLWKNKGVEDED